MSDQERNQQAAEAGRHTAIMPGGTEASQEDLALLEKYSRTFTGTFAHTLDSKGRMVIPLAFRDMLGKVFTIAPAFDFKSIAVYPEIAYVRMREARAQAALKAEKREYYDKYLKWLDAYTFRSQECDGQGRVLLPARLRQVVLGDDKEVDIMGSGDYLSIAARIKCDDELRDFIDNIDEVLRGMNSHA